MENKKTNKTTKFTKIELLVLQNALLSSISECITTNRPYTQAREQKLSDKLETLLSEYK